MTYDALERSRSDAAPVEFYRFAVGSAVQLQTSADQRIWLNGEMYEPYRISRQERDRNQEDHAGPIEVTADRLNPIAVLFLGGMPETPIGIVVYQQHDGDSEAIPVFTGKVVSCAFDGADATLRLESNLNILKRKIPRLRYQPLCVWPLYGAGCGVNRALFVDAGTVQVVSGNDVTAAVFATRADGWFEGGYLKLADGTQRQITAHVGNVVTLSQPFFGLQVGAAFTAQAGCMKREVEDCAAKFNNRDNFLAFPQMKVKNPYKLGIT